MAASSGVLTVWAWATGASFTGVTVRVTTPVLLNEPSLTEKTMVSPPLKWAFGV